MRARYRGKRRSKTVCVRRKGRTYCGKPVKRKK